ncbi:DUF7519 family protein [Halovivax asiaticus]|nr:hypothetical protein [Halovivax asiaticus]
MTASRSDGGTTESWLERRARQVRDAIGRPAPARSEGTARSIDRRPGRTSAALATALSVVTALLVPTQTAQLFGLPGVVLLAGGAITGSRRSVGYGFAVLTLGLLLGGLQGVPALALVCGAFCATVAWDVGRYGITVGEQLGRAASTIRIELAHAIASATVGLVGVAVGYAAFLAGPSEQPVSAVALVLLGATALLAAMRT